jgi:hypothetical protein
MSCDRKSRVVERRPGRSARVVYSTGTMRAITGESLSDRSHPTAPRGSTVAGLELAFLIAEALEAQWAALRVGAP